MSNDNQISRLTRALSTTTATLLGSQNVEDTILSYSSPYKKALHQAMTSLGSGSSLIRRRKGDTSFQNLHSSTNGKNYFNNVFTDSKTSFKVLSYISDDLLNDLGDDREDILSRRMLKDNGEIKGKSKSVKQEPSLFQGFEASLPIINETLADQRAVESLQSKITGNIEDSNESRGGESMNLGEMVLLPPKLSPDRINDSYSLKFLSSLNSEIVDNLDLLEIQKKIAASEIRELDDKLDRLKTMRDMVFRRIAKIEQNESVLENSLSMIGERTSFLREYGLEMDSGADTGASSTPSIDQATNCNVVDEKIIAVGNDSPSNDIEASRSVSLSESEATSPLMSRSVYKKLKEKHQSPSVKLHSFYSEHNRKGRKTFPTLQQYYNRGSKITTFEKAHEDGIICLDFDVPFGTLSTAGHMDHCVKIWDLSQHKKVAEMCGHLASISCMQMDRRYNMLITGGRDAVLKMWNLNLAMQMYQEKADLKTSSESSCVYTFDSHVDEITSLSFDSGHLVSGSQDRTIRQWDLTTGKCMQTIDVSFAGRISQGSSSNNTTMLTSTDPSPIIGALQCFDAALATGTRDGVVRLWDLRSGQIIRTLEGHTDAITALKFDSKNLVTSSLDRSVRVWDLRTGTLADAFAYESPVLSLDFDTNNIVVANGEGSVKIFDRESGKQWDCFEKQDQTSEESEDTETSIVEEATKVLTAPSTTQFVRYKDGYMIEGRDNGDVNAWAI